MLNVEIAYVTPNVQIIKAVCIHEGASIADVIEVSQIIEEQPQINLQSHRVGIFGQIKPLTARVVDGDRVEIYTPLLMDPKEARLLRLKSQPT